MKYNELHQLNSRTSRHRVGRGISAGRGKSAGRGTKGQGSRKSGGVRPGFEGGQMPLYMRLPKLRGFKSQRVPAETVKVGQLASIKKTSIDNKTLLEAKFVNSAFSNVKLLAGGEISDAKEVRLQAASRAAAAAIEKAGGKFIKVERPARPTKVKPAAVKP
jgi:large subunit ribosomal protein L15